MTNDGLGMTSGEKSYRFSGFRGFCAGFLVLSLLPMFGCGHHIARNELELNDYYFEILKRVDRDWIGDDRFFEDNLLGNPAPEVRQWCAIALGRIGSPGALPLLYRAVHTGDAAVRAASAFSIGAIEDREVLGQQYLPPDPQVVTELKPLLDDPSISVRMRAVEALGKTGSRSEAEEIVRRLENFTYTGSAIERAYFGFAITALVRLKDPAALPILERLANASDSGIQRRALDALVRLRDEKAVPRYIGKPESTDPEVRFYAARDPRPSTTFVTDAVYRTIAASRRNSTIATIKTTRGTLELELFREDAPLTVASFILAAESGAYNGFVFEQEIPSQRIEGMASGSQAGFGRAMRGELNLRPFERGSVGMASAGGKKNDGRFFITLAPQPLLDGIDTCFGRVISGVQVADKIVPGDRILQVNIKETIGIFDRLRY
jgi:cyclophilin family peptidyl-prolyl cis-trans isomerase